MRQFGWSKNDLKLQRAISKAGENATEEQIKAEYQALGGLVDESYSKATEVAEPNKDETIIESTDKAPKVKKAKSSK